MPQPRPNPAIPRRSREEQQAETREKLLDAARHAFAQAGYGGASIDRIVAEAGFTKGAFYSNFESKEAIFLELLSRHMVSEAVQLEQLVQGQRPVSRILADLDRWLESLNQDADWSLLSMELQLQARRSTSVATTYNRLFRQHRERLGGLVAHLFALSNRELPAPAPQIAAALMALAHGLALQGGKRPDAADPAGPLIHLVLRSLLAAAPKR